jgi:hypothetical protein
MEHGTKCYIRNRNMPRMLRKMERDLALRNHNRIPGERIEA